MALTKAGKSVCLLGMGDPIGLVNWEQLDMVAFGYTQDFVEIYHEFLMQTPELLDALEQARVSGDVDAVIAYAHKLMGSALNFGFPGVSGPMTALERDTKERKNLVGAEEKIRLSRENFEAGRKEVFSARGI
jgi:HPt (histidine-containing phosphotransfer) domain-containing protein